MLICMNETVETSNDEVHHNLVDELTHGLTVPEQVRILVANELQPRSVGLVCQQLGLGIPSLYSLQAQTASTLPTFNSPAVPSCLASLEQSAAAHTMGV